MWILRISASKLFTFFTLEKRHFAPHLLIDTILTLGFITFAQQMFRVSQMRGNRSAVFSTKMTFCDKNDEKRHLTNY